jgi:hypothetical protein
MIMNQRFSWLVVCLLALSTTRCASPKITLGPVAQVGEIQNMLITECSGMAPSHSTDNVLWMLNDSGNDPIIFAVSPQGDALATVRVEGVTNRDWEDIASFKMDGHTYLMICEVGDNDAVHETCDLHVVKEPALDATSVVPAWTIHFKYEDGPRDCESVFVDAINQRILLLSKRNKPPVLYELPLKPLDPAAVQTAKRVGDVLTMPQPREGETKWVNMPTSMDMSPDRTMLAIQNYNKLLVYTRPRGGSWLDTLATKPIVLYLPPLKQMEAICFSRDSQSIYVSTEKLPAPILRLDVIR